jgi:hypothetical protein
MLLWTRLSERRVGLHEFPATQQAHGGYEAPGRIAHFFVKALILIQFIMTVCVGLIVADVAIDQGGLDPRALIPCPLTNP